MEREKYNEISKFLKEQSNIDETLNIEGPAYKIIVEVLNKYHEYCEFLLKENNNNRAAYFLDRFTDKARKMLHEGILESKDIGLNYTGTEHLLLGILKQRTWLTSVLEQEHKLTYNKFKERLIKEEENREETERRIQNKIANLKQSIITLQKEEHISPDYLLSYFNSFLKE